MFKIPRIFHYTGWFSSGFPCWMIRIPKYPQYIGGCVIRCHPQLTGPACDGVKGAKLQAAVSDDATDRHTEPRVQGKESTFGKEAGPDRLSYTVVGNYRTPWYVAL